MSLILYHNPGCSKSRKTLALLRERGLEPEIVEYLRQPLRAGELRAILNKLGVSAHALLRNGDNQARELGLTNADSLSDDDIITLICTHPQLMQRPVLVHDDRARLGRPPEAVLEIL